MEHIETPHANAALARKCLELVRDIAERGASSWDHEVVGYALQELRQVFLESTGIEDRICWPVPASEISGLHELYVELNWVNDFCRDMCRAQRCH